MNMIKCLSVYAAALVLTGWGGTSGWAGDGVPLIAPSSEATIAGHLGCGDGACVDVYKVICRGPTRYIFAFLVDNDILEDNLGITLTGLAPAPIKGQTVQNFIDEGCGAFCPMSILLNRQGSTVGPMQAFAAVSNVNPVRVSYLLDLVCFDSANNLTPTTLTTVQDQ